MERHAMLSTVAHGALLGLAFGYFEQSMPDSRERHMFKYAVLGALGFAALASLRSVGQRPHDLVGAGGYFDQSYD